TIIGNAANEKSMAYLEALAETLIAECFQVGEREDAPLARQVRQVLALSPERSYQHYRAVCMQRGLEPAIAIMSVAPGVAIGADVVYCATSNGGSFLSLSVLAGAEIVCDISRPSDLDR